LTFGSPVMFYFALVFLINMKKNYRRRHSIWHN
jgi:hypothetical protein